MELNNNQNQNTPPTPLSSPPVQKNNVLIGMLILLIVILGLACAYLMMNQSKKNPTYKTTTNTTNSSKATMLASKSSLFFQKMEGRPATGNTLSITDINGAVLKSMHANPPDGFFSAPYINRSGYIGYSKGLLLNNQIYTKAGTVDITAWSVLKPDGTVMSVPVSLHEVLKNYPSEVYITQDDMLLALVHSDIKPTAPFKYDEVNLKTGEEKALFSISQLDPRFFPYIQPQGLSSDGKTIIFLVSDVVIDSQKISGTAMGKFDLSTNAFTVQPLPEMFSTALQSADTRGIQTVGTSLDGSFFIYETTVGGSHTVVPTRKVHIYNLLTKKDIESATSIGLISSNTPRFFFSPDNKYFITHDENKLDIISTDTGSVLHSWDIGDATQNIIDPIGWSDNHTFLFDTDTTTDPGNFTGENSVGHSYDLDSGKTVDYTKDLGILTAVFE